MHFPSSVLWIFHRRN